MVCAFFCCCSLLSLSIIVVVYTFLVLIQQHHHTTYSHPSGISKSKKGMGNVWLCHIHTFNLHPIFPHRRRSSVDIALALVSFSLSLSLRIISHSPFTSLLFLFPFCCRSTSFWFSFSFSVRRVLSVFFPLPTTLALPLLFFSGRNHSPIFILSLHSCTNSDRKKLLFSLRSQTHKRNIKKSYIVRALSASVEFSECAVFVRVPGEYGRK